MKTIRLTLFFLIVAGSLFAQRFDDVPVTLESPHNTMLVHLHYLQKETYDAAAAARTLYGLSPGEGAQRLAVQLKQIYDGKGLYVRFKGIPQDSLYTDSLSGENIFTPFPRELPGVYLERIDGRWYYSQETVGAIPELHKQVYPFGTDMLLNWLPRFAHNEILGMELWKYIGLMVILGLGILVHLILSRLLNPLVRRLSRSRIMPSLISKELTWKIARLLSVLIVLRLIFFLLPTLQLPPAASSFAVITIRIISTLLIVVILLRVLDVVMIYTERLTRQTESKLDEQLMPILKGILQAVVIVSALVHVLYVLDVNVTTLIAGISIGGLALALAAQDTLKNFFGSLMIFLDRPFQVGDWINFSGVDGTVEEVGFRSTRVRTFANSLVYVPNGKLADMVVDNFGLRVYRRYSTKLQVTYDTPPELIDQFTEGLREIVRRHPRTRKDYFEIHLNDLNAHSLDILFYIFFDVPSWSEELRSRHEVLRAVIELAHTLGVRFAFPTSTVHVEAFPGNGVTSPAYEIQPDKVKTKLENFYERLGQSKRPGNGAGHARKFGTDEEEG